jgi:predicted DNA-binding antitoxin AbrB/MazE fold protein
MAFEVEATYENGVLRPDQPLPLRDRERVTVAVKPRIDHVTESYGLIRGAIDLEALEYLSRSPENSVWESE